MKNINEYFDYLYSLERVGIKYDLKNITRLLKALGNPHTGFRSIHVAGTNGKGAAASFTASILQEQGYKTGLFTSPHLLKFNERIRINGKTINDVYIKRFLNENIKLIKRIKPSFFEVNTALAFKYFADKNVDVAVVECGLGGRLDSTNVLTPDVCIITQIGLDHRQFLGNTLRKIANEKAGIIKPRSNVIISDTNKSLRSIFRNKISKQKKIFIDEFLDIKINKNELSKMNFSLLFKPVYYKLDLTIPLSGTFQARNAAAAMLAASIFSERTHIPLYVPEIKAGLKNVKKNTGYRGRLEPVKVNGTNYIFDVSHNAQAVGITLNELKLNSNDVVIFGIMADKDYKKALKPMARLKTNIIFTKPEYKRALEPHILFKAGIKTGMDKKRIGYCNNIYEALSDAKDKVSGKGRIIITGSFFLAHDAIKALRLEKHFS